MSVPAWRLVAMIACLPGVAAAQMPVADAPAGAAPSPAFAPLPSPVPPQQAQPSWRERVTFEGLVDTYYAYRPGGAALEGAALHTFDASADGFVLAYAELAVAVAPKPVGLRIDLGFGPVADATRSNPGTLDDVLRNIQQAYASFALPAALPVTVDVGKFVTPVGAEVIEARLDWNYSRSFLFNWAIPFTHTGVRLTAQLAPPLTVQALVVNGWDVVVDDNRAKTFGLSIALALPTGTSVVATGMAGQEQPVNVGDDWRFLADVVVTQALGALTLMANGDFGREGASAWYGAAGYARVTPGPRFNLALRGEILRDAAGARLGTGVPTTVEEVTATAGFPIGGNAELRAEARADFADADIYPVNGAPANRQLQLLAAALAWF